MSSLSDKFIFANFSIELLMFLLISIVFGVMGVLIKNYNKDTENIKNEENPFTPAIAAVDIITPTIQVMPEI